MLLSDLAFVHFDRNYTLPHVIFVERRVDIKPLTWHIDNKKWKSHKKHNRTSIKKCLGKIFYLVWPPAKMDQNIVNLPAHLPLSATAYRSWYLVPKNVQKHAVNLYVFRKKCLLCCSGFELTSSPHNPAMPNPIACTLALHTIYKKMFATHTKIIILHMFVKKNTHKGASPGRHPAAPPTVPLNCTWPAVPLWTAYTQGILRFLAVQLLHWSRHPRSLHDSYIQSITNKIYTF